MITSCAEERARACEAGESIKPGAQAPGENSREAESPRQRAKARARFKLSPASRAEISVA
jgi:hypothetical protein